MTLGNMFECYTDLDFIVTEVCGLLCVNDQE